jgi:hypothetical protein
MKDNEEMEKGCRAVVGGKRFGVSVMEKKGGLLTVVFRQQRKVESGGWWLFASEASQEG